jgi:hypothetical protein
VILGALWLAPQLLVVFGVECDGDCTVSDMAFQLRFGFGVPVCDMSHVLLLLQQSGYHSLYQDPIRDNLGVGGRRKVQSSWSWNDSALTWDMLGRWEQKLHSCKVSCASRMG